MPKKTPDRIVFLPEDRQIINEQSYEITPATYKSLFNGAITEGDTTKYYKFLEEIAEKDPDILNTLNTRSAYVTSKEWQIEDADGNPETPDGLALDKMIRDIEGDVFEGLLAFDQLLATFVGCTYLTGLSLSEVITDKEKIIGFNHIPAHFLTFQNSVHYPKLWTQEKPTGEDFNRAKMISHYICSKDPARGYLGNAIAWQYVFKRETLAQRKRFEGKYGKGFLLINMPMKRDGFEENWDTAEELIENYDTVNGAVFEGNVMADYKDSIQTDGDYFFNAEDNYSSNITKIILGQESTTNVEDSNRSTADVHMEVLEQRTIDDIAAIENTINKQLLPMLKPLAGIAESTELYFKFVVSELEATLDEDMDEEGAVEEDTNSAPQQEEGTENE